MRQAPETASEQGAGTGLALGLGMVLLLALTAALLLGQAAVMAARAAAAADLAALAAADAARGLVAGEPCAVAAEVADRHRARLVDCVRESGDTVQVRTELRDNAAFGPATGLARAGPPPVSDADAPG
ncbi:Rv3654c family TadE-like protein [Arthrobacter sp. Hor0625]|uniref:Rv3654c family TadE-like protein n=1 Tax=Arthrobacter sp. Hor0625 TaxID=3457358 RepID=UPI00403EF3B8